MRQDLENAESWEFLPKTDFTERFSEPANALLQNYLSITVHSLDYESS